jgi:hypothetical protein
MAHKPWVSVAAHQLCDAAGLAQEQRLFAYQANEGVWTDVETDFLWMSESAMPFTITELETKADELAAAQPLLMLRNARNDKLKASDWTQGADVPEAIKTPYATYRQALRDITETYQSTDDDGFAWPEEPTV